MNKFKLRLLIILFFLYYLFTMIGCTSIVHNWADEGKGSGYYPSSPDSSSAILIIGESYIKGPKVPGIVDAIESEAISAAIEKGYTVVSKRRDIEKIIEEMRFQYELLSNHKAIKIGQMVGADTILIVTMNNVTQEKKRNISINVHLGKGSAPKSKPTYYLYSKAYVSARLIDAEKALITWTAKYKYGSEDPTNSAVEATRGLMNYFPERN